MTNKRRFADITFQQLNKIVEDKDAMSVPSAPVIYNYGTMTFNYSKWLLKIQLFLSIIKIDLYYIVKHIF